VPADGDPLQHSGPKCWNGLVEHWVGGRHGRGSNAGDVPQQSQKDLPFVSDPRVQMKLVVERLDANAQDLSGPLLVASVVVESGEDQLAFRLVE
jgi:hypothetical protein